MSVLEPDNNQEFQEKRSQFLQYLSTSINAQMEQLPLHLQLAINKRCRLYAAFDNEILLMLLKWEISQAKVSQNFLLKLGQQSLSKTFTA